jgi:hypothetical protein
MKTARDIRVATLIVLIMSYFVVVGADIYGQIVVARTVLEAPPRSLSMLQGEYTLDSSAFWRVVTTLPLILFVAAIVANWRTPRRRLLLISFGGFFVINALSFPFVFGEYLDIVASAYSDTIDPELQRRGAAWERLAFVRFAVVVALGILPLLALARPDSAETEDADLRAISAN